MGFVFLKGFFHHLAVVDGQIVYNQSTPVSTSGFLTGNFTQGGTYLAFADDFFIKDTEKWSITGLRVSQYIFEEFTHKDIWRISNWYCRSKYHRVGNYIL